MARAIPSVLPDMSFEEALEITKIHSVAGTLGKEGIVSRPTLSDSAPHRLHRFPRGGGSRTVHPGEISLAHGGVLFLDELPEYKRSALESLRQPLEDGVITITRSGGSVTYPASFMLCAGMNPVPAAITAAAKGNVPVCPTTYAATAPACPAPFSTVSTFR